MAMIALRPVGSSWQKTTCSCPEARSKTPAEVGLPEGAGAGVLVTVVTLPCRARGVVRAVRCRLAGGWRCRRGCPHGGWCGCTSQGTEAEGLVRPGSHGADWGLADQLVRFVAGLSDTIAWPEMTRA